MTIPRIFSCLKFWSLVSCSREKALVRRQNWVLILAFCDLSPVTSSLDLFVRQLKRTEITLSWWVLSGQISNAGEDFCVTKTDGRWVGSEAGLPRGHRATFSHVTLFFSLPFAGSPLPTDGLPLSSSWNIAQWPQLSRTFQLQGALPTNSVS